MRFIGKLLLWLGGGGILYLEVTPLAQQILDVFESGGTLDMELEVWLAKFALPVFVFGVICAVGLPELGSNKKVKSGKKDL